MRARWQLRTLSPLETATLLETASDSRLGAALLTLTRYHAGTAAGSDKGPAAHDNTILGAAVAGPEATWCEPTMGEHGEKTSSTCGGQHTGAVGGECNHRIRDTRARVHAVGSTQRGAVSGRYDRTRRAAVNTSAADACLATGVRTVGFESTT